MPKSHRQYLDWTPERIISWAGKIGPSTRELIQEVLNRRQYPELAFKTCLGILRCGKTYGADRLEAAAARALRIRGYTYKSIKSILDAKLDSQPVPEEPRQLRIVHSNIRGASSFDKDVEEGGKSC